MALIQSSLIWVAYAVAIGVLLIVATIFVFLYQDPRDRAASVTTVSIITTSALLATVLLMPVDIALVSSTNSPKYGRKKDWATPDIVRGIERNLEIVYYALYSLDALLCLVVVPFTYFWYEEGEADPDEEKPWGQRLWGAFKYTILFILLVVMLFLVGFFLPHAHKAKNHAHLDLDFFKRLLAANHGERALMFALGLLISIGTLVYILYTASGLALLPVAMIRSAPSISAPSLRDDTESQLQQNRDRQALLESRSRRPNGELSSRDMRERDALIREQRTLERRQRVAREALGEGRSPFIKVWHKVEAVFRPVKLLGGFLFMLVALVIWASMLVTGVDKATNSICKANCGYILGHISIFQPVNWVLVMSSKVFPIDYVVFFLLVLLLFASSVVGIGTIGIKFLWVSLFRFRKGRTSPQAMLLATVLLTLIVLAINYAVAMMIAPQYGTFGSQTYCDRLPRHPGEQPDCTHSRIDIKPCSELAENYSAKDVCTASVVSTFINRMTINFPFFGVFDFWAQFAFLGVYLIVFVTTLFRTPQINMDEVDADLREQEEEGLLASTGRRFDATWQDITGRSRHRDAGYGYGTNGHDTRST